MDLETEPLEPGAACAEPPASTAAPPPRISAWTPLAEPLFRALWIASFVSNIGSWMHEVGASWLMTTLEPRPFMVGLVPAAANLATFFLSLPAGALADAMDRRRLLLGTQSYLVLAAGLLAASTSLHLTGPWMLLLFTFLIAIGNAITYPAWQATTPELVPREQLSAAMALGGVGFNLARIVGPALGGLLVARSGPGAVFLMNSVSYVAVVLVIFSWRRPPTPRTHPEPVWQAIHAGMRYARHAPPLRALLIRLTGFITCGSALWALLPLYARRDLGLGATGYGSLLGWLGVGAVAAGLTIPSLRHQLSKNTIVTCASSGIGLQLLGLSYFRHPGAIHAVMLWGGFCWTSTMLSLNTAMLQQTPEWVRSRSAALFLLVFTGSATLGSTLWGSYAEHVGIPVAFLTAGGILLFLSPVLALIPYPENEHVDLRPARSWLPHPGHDLADPDRGPVQVAVHYRVDPARARQFALAMAQLRLVRLRNGARGWQLCKAPGSGEHHVERFHMASWADYLRHHERMTQADTALEQAALAFHTEATPPRVEQGVVERA